MTPTQTKDRDASLVAIAKKELRLFTLDARGGDGWDFHEHGVLDIRSALEAAFAAGQESNL